MPLPLKHFYMIRHGETEANAARIMAGSIDSNLTEKGRDQARAVQPILQKLQIKPEVIIHSNLTRARDTANILNEVLDAPMHETPDIAEIHCGEWEGIPYEECTALLTTFIDPPGGETFDGFAERVSRGKSAAIEKFAPAPVMFVCHGGVFRAVAKLYGLDIQGSRNCHLHEFIPNPANEAFPWDIYAYDYNNGLERNPVDWINPERLIW